MASKYVELSVRRSGACRDVAASWRRLAGVLLVAAVGRGEVRADPLPWFSDVSVAAGFDRVQADPPTTATEPAHMTAGAAAGDFDGDGWVDLYVTRLGLTDSLYRNRGDGTFADVFADAFPESTGPRDTSGPAWADVDNDGDLDLYVTGMHETRNFLHINRGDGTFAEQAVDRGAAVDGHGPHNYGFGAAFGDYNHDGFLDLASSTWIAGGVEPTGAARLLRNRGTAAPGYFEPADADLGGPALVDQRHVFSPRFTDLDRDGHTDLLVVADHGNTAMYWNDGSGRLVSAGDREGLRRHTSDMGVDIGDVNGDGLPDVVITDIEGIDPGNSLFLNNGDRTFTRDDAVAHGGWGWGAVMLDFDNDGDLDVAATNGMDIPNSPYVDDPMRLWVNDGAGGFTERAAELGLTDTGLGRGLLRFDFDRDGDLDLFVARANDTPILYRNNRGDEQSFLRLDLEGTTSNRDGIGALIELIVDLDRPDDRQVREVSAGPHFVSQSEFIAHFGLGPDVAFVDELLIRWPSGVEQRLSDVAANQTLHLVEPIPEPTSLLLAVAGGAALLRRR